MLIAHCNSLPRASVQLIAYNYGRVQFNQNLKMRYDGLTGCARTSLSSSKPDAGNSHYQQRYPQSVINRLALKNELVKKRTPLRTHARKHARKHEYGQPNTQA